MKHVFYTAIIVFITNLGFAQTKVTLNTDSTGTKISKHIYGHFAEHLGRCIYDGIYVGDNSKVSNTDGVRNDIIEALKKLNIPNLRWPGGCFADTYHWKLAIGPKENRKPIENMSWGNVRETNAFGTHEFLNLCETLGAEPYLAVNMNSGSVEEAAEWVQYVNHKNNSSYLTDLREKNGRQQPWDVKFWGIGNESWDCGGDMTAEYYVNLYNRYARGITSYDNSEKLYRIAVGPGHSGQYPWMETVMKNIPLKNLEGVSIHHYSVIDWADKKSSFEFTEDHYFTTMKQAWDIDEFISRNKAIMDKYDPDKKVALIVDEWGGWYETDPSGNGQLYQQNTIRDAMIAGLTLNIFNNHADRVRMANLAQTVNVLQAVILTEGEKMILTPTYHVMEMYKVHQDATLIPVEVDSELYSLNDKELPTISVSASKNENGNIHISLTNIDSRKNHDVKIDLGEIKAKNIAAEVLKGNEIQDRNTFDSPEKIKPENFKSFSLKKNILTVNMPKNSVVVIELTK